MDDLRQKDLSNIPVQEMTKEERQELRRRFKEFVGMIRKSKEPIVGEPEKPKKVQKWDPRMMAGKQGKK